MNEFGHAAHAGGDGGDTACHGFECGESEGFHLAGEEHEVGEREEFVDVVLFAEEVDAVLNAVGDGEMLCDGAVGAVADEQESSGHGLGDAGEDFDHVGDALDGAEVGEVDEEALVGLGVAGAHGGDEFRLANVDVAVDEVADDLDFGGDVECFAGAVAEIAGDGGNSVRLLDAELGDGQIGAIEADEGDVGAVQGSDEGEMAATDGEHLAGEQGADGVGYGVVDVEEIERVELGDLGHAGGESEVVGWVLEEGVVGDGDFMEVNVGLTAGETEGLGVGDEVDVVSACGEFDAEFGGDDAGASVGGVTGDTDSSGLHGLMYPFQLQVELHDFFVAGVGSELSGCSEDAEGTETSIIDELRSIWLRKSFWDDGCQGFALGVARGA